ncbi:MAG: serine hydrolase [Thermomicrobiales bacterium]
MPTPTEREQATEAAATALIAEFAGQAAFLAQHLGTGATIGHQPERIMPTASTIKLLVLAELYRQVEAGDASLDESLAIHPDDRRHGSGILKDLSPDLRLSARDHAILMTALSDNTSTAVLVRRLGLERIIASARAWGLPDTNATFNGATIRDYATSTPRDIVRLLTLIGTDQLASPAASAAIREILVTQQHHDQIGRYLPYNQYDRRGPTHPGPVIIRSKSGFTAPVRVDAGLVELPDGTHYAICLMTDESRERHFRPDHDGAILNGRISKLIFDTWSPAAAAPPAS